MTNVWPLEMLVKNVCREVFEWGTHTLWLQWSEPAHAPGPPDARMTRSSSTSRLASAGSHPLCGAPSQNVLGAKAVRSRTWCRQDARPPATKIGSKIKATCVLPGGIRVSSIPKLQLIMHIAQWCESDSVCWAYLNNVVIATCCGQVRLQPFETIDGCACIR